MWVRGGRAEGEKLVTFARTIPTLVCQKERERERPWRRRRRTPPTHPSRPSVRLSNPPSPLPGGGVPRQPFTLCNNQMEIKEGGWGWRGVVGGGGPPWLHSFEER